MATADEICIRNTGMLSRTYSTFVEYTIAYKYYNEQDRVLEMLHISVKQKTILTFSVLMVPTIQLHLQIPLEILMKSIILTS